MKAQDIHKDDTFIVSPGRSVLTAKRGMAHAGGKITLRDLRSEDPAETMAGFVASGKVSVDEEAVLARKAKAADTKKREKEAIAEGVKRRGAADKVAADKVAAAKAEGAKKAEAAKAEEAKKAEATKAEEAKKAEAAKAEEAKKAPATQDEIIGAILMLDKANTEHWTNGGAPMVPAIETVLGKSITGKQRDEAAAAMAAK